MARIADIPPEVLLQIFEHTRPDAHRSLPWVPPSMKSFPAYALVCRAWTATAQRALFRLAEPSPTSTAFFDTLKQLHRSGSTIPGAVDKLKIELGLGWSFGALAQTISLCENVRHIDLRYMSDVLVAPPAGFTNDDLATLSGTRSVTHLSAVILLENCNIIPQLVRVWPELQYLELRGEFPPQCVVFRDGSLRNLRELRLHARCDQPFNLPHLDALELDGSHVPLSNFMQESLAHVRMLHIQAGHESIHPMSLSCLPTMKGLKALTLTLNEIDAAVMEALPIHIEELGVQLRLVLNYAEDIASLIRSKRLKCLRYTVIYILDELDDFEERHLRPVADACSSSNVQLCLRHHSDLWDVPISYE